MRLIALISVFLAATVAGAAEPYDFRGAQLGMPLSEFKKLPFPDSQPAAVPDREAPEVICTGHPNAHALEILLRPYGADKPLGVIKCMWATLKETKSTKRPYYALAAVNVAGTLTTQVTYYFLQRPDDTEPRLFRIRVPEMETDRFERIAEGLKQRFGPPTAVENGIVQNRMGAQFPNTTLLWRNEQSSIFIAQRSGTIDKMALRYDHKALSDYWLKAQEKLEGKPGEKM